MGRVGDYAAYLIIGLESQFACEPEPPFAAAPGHLPGITDSCSRKGYPGRGYCLAANIGDFASSSISICSSNIVRPQANPTDRTRDRLDPRTSATFMQIPCNIVRGLQSHPQPTSIKESMDPVRSRFLLFGYREILRSRDWQC